MTDDSGPKADGINLAEIRRRALGDVVGGQPEPLRKRAYYRALKSGKEWALKRKATPDSINELWKNIILDDRLKWNQVYVVNADFMKGQK